MCKAVVVKNKFIHKTLFFIFSSDLMVVVSLVLWRICNAQIYETANSKPF